MQFRLAALVLLPGIVLASPTYKERISIIVEDDQGVSAHYRNNHEIQASSKIPISKLDVCLRVCWPETPTCPKGWVS